MGSTATVGARTPVFKYQENGQPMAHRYIYLDLPLTEGFQLEYTFYTDASGKPLSYAAGSDPPADGSTSWGRLLIQERGRPVQYNIFYSDREVDPAGLTEAQCFRVTAGPVIMVPRRGATITSIYDHFAPAAEALKVAYHITNLGPPFSRVKAEIYKSGDDSTPVKTIEGLPAGDGDNVWEAWYGDLAENSYIKLEDAPYKVKIIPGTGDQWSPAFGDEKLVKLELAALHVRCTGFDVVHSKRGKAYAFYRYNNTDVTKGCCEATAVALWKDHADRNVPSPVPVDLEWTLVKTSRVGPAIGSDVLLEQMDGFPATSDDGFKTTAKGAVATEGNFALKLSQRSSLRDVAGDLLVAEARLREANPSLVDRDLDRGDEVQVPKMGIHRLRFKPPIQHNAVYHFEVKVKAEQRAKLSKPKRGEDRSEDLTALRVLNPYVLEMIETYPRDGTHSYYWPRGSGWTGTTRSLTYKGEEVCTADPDGLQRCYCCGISFEAFFRTYEKWCQDQGTEFQVGRLTTADSMRHFRGKWFGTDGNTAMCRNAIVSSRIGDAVAPADAVPGDFVQLNRSATSGHSVVFIAWLGSRFRYWSTQPGTNGIGFNTEYAAELNIGRVVLPEPGT